MWLSYKDGEVATFHPAFAEIGARVLQELGLSTSHHWEHHPASAGVGIVPDFVLVESQTGRWVLIVEIKRRPDAVVSERSQIQAKGYAEANRHHFSTGRPCYFALTNMEMTQVYALGGERSPRECLIEGMAFDSGRFAQTPEAEHKAAFGRDLARVVEFCLTTTDPVYANVWPTVVQSVYQYASNMPFDPLMDPVRGVPDVVRGYFAIDHGFMTRSEILIRCLLVEYLRGLLRRYNHDRRNYLSPVGTTLTSAANAMAAIRRIDFHGVIEGAAAQLYLSLRERKEVQTAIQAYLSRLQAERVDNHAASRNDASQLVDLLIEKSRPRQFRDARGKAATDPELAALLSAVAITAPDQRVLDPGCGEGNLLSAAYDRFRNLELDHASSLDRIYGMEVDSLAARIAALRLAIKEPKVVSDEDPCHIRIADMFSLPEAIGEADVILMNPPFKRYEAQDEEALPPELRAHILGAVESLGGPSEVAVGQWNSLAVYSEFVVKAAKEGATLAFILDNKWFHNKASEPLRKLFLERCRILAVLTYPHGRFFENLMIATSIIIMKKETQTEGNVVFARIEDPASTDATAAAEAIRNGPVPEGWTIHTVPQSEMTNASWKRHLSTDLISEYRQPPLVKLPDLFARSRRGSLAKEGGGIVVYEFPRNRSNYGPRRLRHESGTPFKTRQADPLTREQNNELRNLASQIPRSCLGYAINKADTVRSYVLSEQDVTKDMTIELPLQRQPAYRDRYKASQRVAWAQEMDDLLASIDDTPELAEYVAAIEQEVGLNRNVLPDHQRWVVLREPYAGELIIPRKLRTSHHVHINPFALKEGRQVRLSSNFLSYGGCLAIDEESGLDAERATTLIAAWLVSSFGHLQFELESNNREGLRTIEKSDAARIWVPDPRSLSLEGREKIVEAFRALPFSVSTEIHPELQPGLDALDDAFAEELSRLLPDFEPRDALFEVHEMLRSFHESRQP